MADTVVQYVINISAQDAQKTLEILAKVSQQASISMDKLGDESKDTADDFRKLDTQSKKSSKSLKLTARESLNLASSLSNISTGFNSAISLAQRFAGAAIAAARSTFDMSRAVVDSVNQLNDLSARSGLATNSIQGLIVAFEGSGQSAQSAEAFISRFPRLYADLEAGSSRATEAAKRLGVSIKDQSGNMRSADEILSDVTSSLQAIEDPTERAKEGFLLLGRGAGEFLQALGQTSNFENFVELADTFGVETSAKATAGAARFQEQIAFLSLAFKGLQQRVVNSLGGIEFFNNILKKVIISIVFVGDVLQENEENIQTFVSNLGKFANGVFVFFSQVGNKLLSFLSLALSAQNELISGLADGLNSLGIVSDQTFNNLQKGLAQQEQALAAFADIFADLTAGGDISRITGGDGASDRQRRASEIIEKILAGVETSAKGAKPSLDGLADSIDNVARKADEQSLIDVEGALELIRRFREESSNLSPEMQKLNTDIDKFRNAVQDLKIAGLDASEAQEIVNKLQRERTQLIDDEAEALKKSNREKREQKIAGVAGVAGTLATGSIAGIASLINPIAGQIIGTLEAIGSKTPEERREELLLQVQAIRDGISFLPEIFLSILPQLALALTEAIFDGTVRAFQNLIKLIVDSFNNLFSFRDVSPDGERETLRSRIGDFLRDFFDPSTSATFASGGRFIPSAESGIRFTGMSDGLAMLHRGEFVVPQSGQRPQQVDRQLNRSGGGMNIIINSLVTEQNAVDQLVRQIENRFNNSYGTSSSNLFGGR